MLNNNTRRSHHLRQTEVLHRFSFFQSGNNTMNRPLEKPLIYKTALQHSVHSQKTFQIGRNKSMTRFYPRVPVHRDENKTKQF